MTKVKWCDWKGILLFWLLYLIFVFWKWNKYISKSFHFSLIQPSKNRICSPSHLSRFFHFSLSFSSSLPHGFEPKSSSKFWFDQRQRRSKSASTQMSCIMVIRKRVCELGKLEAWSFHGGHPWPILEPSRRSKTEPSTTFGRHCRACRGSLKACVLHFIKTHQCELCFRLTPLMHSCEFLAWFVDFGT